MTGHDSAFLWETEVLRASRRSTSGGGSNSVIVDDEDWVTLREASEATGVPTSTIRKWARHDNIPSFLERTPNGHLRIVSMKGIRRWADSIDRDIASSAEPAAVTDSTAEEVDLTVEEESGQTPVPEGSMLVPLDAWNRMLNQLGNLHEAGQQLAEARERAAKAETEAAFLRERLRDLREEKERRPEEAGPGPEAGTDEPAPSTASLLRRIYADWRRRRR